MKTDGQKGREGDRGGELYLLLNLCRSILRSDTLERELDKNTQAPTEITNFGKIHWPYTSTR